MPIINDSEIRNFAANDDGINDRPTFAPGTVAAASYAEDAQPIALLQGASIFDPDEPASFGGATLVVRMDNPVTGESITLPNADGFSHTSGSVTYAGQPFATYPTGTGFFTFTFHANATPAIINLFIDNFKYATNENIPTAVDRSVTFTFTDGGNTGSGGPLGTSISQIIHLTPTNDAPFIGGLGAGATNFSESSGPVSTPVAIAPNLTVGDIDNGTLASATARIVSGFVAGQDVLAFAAGPAYGNIAGSYDDASGILTLTSAGATATLAEFQAALRSVTYTNGSDMPTTGNRHVQFAVNDGTVTGTSSSNKIVSVTATNDLPIVDLNGGDAGTSATLSYSEGEQPKRIAPTATVSDPDSANFDTGTLTVSFTQNGDGDDRLNITHVGEGSGQIGRSGFNIRYEGTQIATFSGGTSGSTPLVITFDADATPVAVAALLKQIDYYNISEDPATAAREVRFILTDGDGATGVPAFATINPVGVNDAPVLDLDTGTGGIDYMVSYTEGDAAVAIGSGVLAGDVESGGGDRIESATITLTDRVAGDALTVTASLPSGVTADTIVGAGTITVQITGTGTVAEYAAIIESILYSTTSDDPTVGGTDTERQIIVVVNDGALDSVAATATVTITATDDAPVAQADDVSTDEATIFNGSVLADNGAGADSDVDGPAPTVSAVNGSSGNVGAPIVLASGALLTLNGDGTFSYDPNSKFDATPATGSGASNTPAHDSFTYTLSGGGSATVSVSISGIDSDDVLRGTSGSDMMSGGAGDDRYFVDQAGDLALEASGQGYDRVLASVSYVLAAGSEIEKLTTSDNFATTPIDLTGNELGQYLFGNAGANRLDGAGGADVMVGLGGDDRYYIDTAADRVIEASGEGYDRVLSAVSWTLQAGSHVDKITTIDNLATTAINLTGNNLGQYLFGNAGANTLDGGGGGDVMAGLEGDDRYIIRSSADRVIEAAGGGNDRVFAGASFVLQPGSSVEKITTIDNLGTAAIDLTGNELAQFLYGNEGANVLDGKLGNDILTGSGGADTFQFTTVTGANNVDRIADFVSGVDKIALDDFIFVGLATGALDPNAFFVGSAAHDADDRIIYNQTTGALYFDYDGNGIGTAVQFATLDGHPILAATDVTVI